MLAKGKVSEGNVTNYYPHATEFKMATKTSERMLFNENAAPNTI